MTDDMSFKHFESVLSSVSEGSGRSSRKLGTSPGMPHASLFSLRE